MTIEILPARLANQIAAGEVVERPASVVKELVENSLDAGATSIKIDIEKGGAKRIRISDNGCGIVKDELTLALSRHATSKIKNLADLEGICSLGFRGEALASISSVARLTLTSKTHEQESAWQACAQGRDMDVVVQPAAHPTGTTIDVVDLFFNTPARRKFLRTDKTEFSHIEEVIKRIALARFDVAFVLTHNHKIVRQYRVASTDAQRARRVAQVCGQSFIDHALMVDCQHEGLQLSGWIASPDFSRSQNDLCYSYVNGRMMRDKLINHAIRQSYQELLPADNYPAFVLFLTLNVRDVDVNVHPAKHEVRFHQGRYVHDFIYTVCHQALTENQTNVADVLSQNEAHAVDYQTVNSNSTHQHVYEQAQEYITPLKRENTNNRSVQGHTSGFGHQHGMRSFSTPSTSQQTSHAYQQLMTPHNNNINSNALDESHHGLTPKQAFQTIDEQFSAKSLQFVEPAYALYIDEHVPRLLSLKKLEEYLQLKNIELQWQKGLISQPLLLPIKLTINASDLNFVEQHKASFEKLGIVIQALDKSSVQIRQFPAILRNRDVNQSFTQLLEALSKQQNVLEKPTLDEKFWQTAMAKVLVQQQAEHQGYDENSIKGLCNLLLQLYPTTINQVLSLNSTTIDLTSAKAELN